MRPAERVCVFAQLDRPGLGDMVLRNVLLALVRRARPGASVTLVVGATVARDFADLLATHMYATDVLCCPDPYDSDERRWRAFVAELAGRRYDMCVVDPDTYTLDAGHARAAGIGVRVGQPPGALADPDLTHPVRLSTKRSTHADLYDVVDGFARALALDEPLRPDEVVPELPRRPEELPELAAPAPRIALHPGGAPRFNRRWPLDRYVELCTRLVDELGASLYLFGTSRELTELSILRDGVLGRCPGAVVHLSLDSSLNRTANLLAGVDLFIGNDSGPGHIAAAVGTPGVIIYGPGSGIAWLARIYPKHRGVSVHTCVPLSRPYETAQPGWPTVPQLFRCENGCASEHHGEGPYRPLWRCANGCAIEYHGPRRPYPKCLEDIDVPRVWAATTAQLRHATRSAPQELRR